MSYDVSVEVDGVVVYEANYTSNVGPMLRHALGCRLPTYDAAPCSEAAGPLRSGVERMRRTELACRAMDPLNGWGNYDGALKFLNDLATAAAKYPDGTVRVSA